MTTLERDTARQILENQHLILHGLRVLLWQNNMNGPVLDEIQNGMDHTHKFLRDILPPKS